MHRRAPVTRNTGPRPQGIRSGERARTVRTGRSLSAAARALLAALLILPGALFVLVRPQITWAAPSITVTFDCNGGTAATSPYEQVMTSGVPTALDAEGCTFTGRTFGGWATSDLRADNQIVSYANLQNVTFNSSRTLHAIWLGTFTVTFDVNSINGTGSMSPQSEDTNNTALASNAGQISRVGFSFAGWNTEADGIGGTAYADGADFDFVEQGDTTLYAQWEATITFDKNDPSATGTMADQTESTNTALDAENFSLSGYVFDGWNTDPGGAGVSYADGDNYNFPTDGTDTLYAQWTADEYTVSYTENGGDPVTDDTYTVDGTAITLPTPSRTGYTFDGWFTDDSTFLLEVVSPYTPSGDITLYAGWTINTYDVTFDENGGDPETDLLGEDYGSSVTLPTPTRTGYSFDGWDDGSGGALIPAGSFTIPDSDTALTAQWTIDTYDLTITIDGAGSGAVTVGLESCDEISSPCVGPVEYGATLTLIATADTGNNFTGWSGADSGECVGDAAGTCTLESVAGVKFITATFALDVYDVIYEENGGDPVSDDGYTYGTTGLTLPTPSRAGYDFVGWFTDDGTFTDEKTSPYTPSDDITLYAQWGSMVTFNGNGGTGCVTNQASALDNVALTANTCLRTGYTFTGWNTVDSGPGTPYADGGLYDFASDGSDTLYARWTINKYDVTFVENGGAPVSDLNNKDYNSSVTLPTPTRTGYSFDGWSDGVNPTLIPAGSFTIPDGDITLTAQWTINSYSVAATAGTGGTVTSGGGAYNYHDGPTITATPSTGYTFDAWTGGGSACTTNPVCNLALIDADYPSLVATFTPEVYDVTYDENGGGAVSDGTYTYGTAGIDPLPTPTRAGFDFDGWFTDDNTFLIEVTSPYSPSSDITLHAKWVATATYTVDYNTNGGDATPAQDTSINGSSVTLPNPGSRASYNFSGWYDNAGLSGSSVGDAGDPYVPLANVTLYAKWSPTGGGGGGGGDGGSSAPIGLGAPGLSGYTAVGETLIATPGTWSTATSYKYHWYRCTSPSTIAQIEVPADCTFVTNDVESSYVVQPADFGFWIRVRVRATGPGGTTSFFSATSAQVGPKPVNTKVKPPRIAGFAAVGQILTAKRGQWANSVSTFSYQWYRCTKFGAKNPKSVPLTCTAITGAASRTYTVKAADRGLFLRVRVTATGPTGQGFRMSKSTGFIPN